MVPLYKELLACASEMADVLTPHVGDATIGPKGETDMLPGDVFSRDMALLASADAVIAEVSIPSLGVGYELGCAVAESKPVLCLYHEGASLALSAIICGNPLLAVKEYGLAEEAKAQVASFIRSLEPEEPSRNEHERRALHT